MSLSPRFSMLTVSSDKLDDALGLSPLYHRQGSKNHIVLFEEVDRTQLEPLGPVSNASLVDIFIAKQQEVTL